MFKSVQIAALLAVAAVIFVAAENDAAAQTRLGGGQMFTSGGALIGNWEAYSDPSTIWVAYVYTSSGTMVIYPDYSRSDATNTFCNWYVYEGTGSYYREKTAGELIINESTGGGQYRRTYQKIGQDWYDDISSWAAVTFTFTG